MSDRLKVLPQYLLPKTALTMCMGWLANKRAGSATTMAIERFIARYGVNMAEAANADPASYASFNEFFTRPLRVGARALASEAEAAWLCPVDGTISQFGQIERDQIFQAKGHHYSIRALVGGDTRLAAEFEDGYFACLYLSPKDYHRIHMPCAGSLRQMVYVPGELFSVNPTTARGVPGLFARNERVVCVFDTAYGPLASVLVGATIVGSMATVWHEAHGGSAGGVINPPRAPHVRVWDYAPGQVQLARGAEMGRFLLGSTVVLLWPQQSLAFNRAWCSGGSIRMGEAMAGLKTANI